MSASCLGSFRSKDDQVVEEKKPEKAITPARKPDPQRETTTGSNNGETSAECMGENCDQQDQTMGR